MVEFRMEGLMKVTFLVLILTASLPVFAGRDGGGSNAACERCEEDGDWCYYIVVTP